MHFIAKNIPVATNRDWGGLIDTLKAEDVKHKGLKI